MRHPESGSGTSRSCWHDPVKLPAKTDPERLTRKNVAFLQPLPLVLVRCVARLGR
jgi:hypothetical protein